MFTTRTKSVKSGRQAHESWDTEHKQGADGLYEWSQVGKYVQFIACKCNPNNFLS